MNNRALLIDLALAVAVAAILLVAAPGLAIVGLVAVAVLVVCGLSLLVPRLRRRSDRTQTG